MAAMAMCVYSLMSSGLMLARRARAILESASLPKNFSKMFRLVTLPMNWKIGQVLQQPRQSQLRPLNRFDEVKLYNMIALFIKTASHIVYHKVA